MSNYVTPFLVLNVGAEMVFVVAQRLQAQSVAAEKADLGSLGRCDALFLSTRTRSLYTLVELRRRHV